MAATGAPARRRASPRVSGRGEQLVAGWPNPLPEGRADKGVPAPLASTREPLARQQRAEGPGGEAGGLPPVRTHGQRRRAETGGDAATSSCHTENGGAARRGTSRTVHALPRGARGATAPRKTDARGARRLLSIGMCRPRSGQRAQLAPYASARRGLAGLRTSLLPQAVAAASYVRHRVLQSYSVPCCERC